MENNIAYGALYLICNVLRMYSIFRFWGLFFNQSGANRRMELISYGAYYVLNSAIFLVFTNPFANLFFNIGFYFVLTLHYRGSLCRRIVAALLLYVLGLLTESMAYFTLRSLGVEYDGAAVVITTVSSTLMLFLIILVAGNFKNLRDGYEMPRFQWAAIFLIPLGSLYVSLVVMPGVLEKNYVHIVVAVAAMLLINIMTFSLYDTLNRKYRDRAEKELMEQQNDFYLRQLAIMEKSQEEISGLRHDMKNHMVAIDGLLGKGDTEGIETYINKIMETLNHERGLAASGNVVVDALLNAKIHEAQQKGIAVSLHIAIPKKLPIESFDLTVMLGNLLDNAIEAAGKLTEGKWVQIEIRYEKSALFMSVSNSFKGKLLKKGGGFSSTKAEKRHHGLGLKNVENAVRKYEGTLELIHTDTRFTAELILYVGHDLL